MTRHQQQLDNDDDFENGVLKDGRSYRTPMWAMDSVQRCSPHDALGNGGLALHRPGGRYLRAGQRTTDHAVIVTGQAMCEQARQQAIDHQTNAWRGTTTNNNDNTNKQTGDARADAYLAMCDAHANAWRA